MQNGVFLHGEEDVNTGCLRTLFLITLFKFNTDVIDDFKERYYWSTSQTSLIDCKSRMNKSFFVLSPYAPPTLLFPPLRKRLYNQSTSVTYLGSLEPNHIFYKGSLSKDVWNGDCWMEGPWGSFKASHAMQQLNPMPFSVFTCDMWHDRC